jgi:hypothetical protein
MSDQAVELAQLSAVAGDESRLPATLPSWVNDHDW